MNLVCSLTFRTLGVRELAPDEVRAAKKVRCEPLALTLGTDEPHAGSTLSTELGVRRIKPGKRGHFMRAVPRDPRRLTFLVKESLTGSSAKQRSNQGPKAFRQLRSLLSRCAQHHSNCSAVTLTSWQR